jgi:alanine dehydrogenase
MSEVAGRLAVQAGARCLEKTAGGRGVLLGGVPGVPPGKVVVLGGGTVGKNAAVTASGLGGRVTVLDVDLQRLRWFDDTFHGRIETLFSSPHTVASIVERADLLIGAVLLAGARAPTLVTREMVARMRPGAAVVDVAVDQGGCVETTRPTTHADPIYLAEGVVHYGVANMPGAVPRTSTFALHNATLPYALRLADAGWEAACRADPALARGLNVVRGAVVHPAVAEALGEPCSPWSARAAA